MASLEAIAVDAAALAPGIEDPASLVVTSYREFMSGAARTPTAEDLMACRRSGEPWATVTRIAQQIKTAQGDLTFLARELIWPVEDLRWRLFHLAVLGQLLLAIETSHAITSLRPLSASAPRAAYSAESSDGASVNIWFEAAGIWSCKKAESPYRAAVDGIAGAGTRALGPDLLVENGDRALVIEVKYSLDSGYVASGYDQVVAYMTELRSRLFEDVEGLLVGPKEVVTSRGSTTLVAGRVQTLHPGDIGEAIHDWLKG